MNFKVANNVLEMCIYGEIGENWYDNDGITVTNVKQALDGSSGYSSVLLRINSPGGDAFEGAAICNVLKDCGKDVHTKIDGIAASAASIVAMAGKTITMPRNTMLMIHNASGFCMGDGDEMIKCGDTLNKISASLAQTYVERTGKSAAEIQKMMDDESWLGAQECLDLGLCTAVPEPPPGEVEGALATARTWKVLARFKNLPMQLKATTTRASKVRQHLIEGKTSINEAMASMGLPPLPLVKCSKNTNENGCDCECEACMAGECDECDNVDCHDSDCLDCPMQEGEMDAKLKSHPHQMIMGRAAAIRKFGAVALATAQTGKQTVSGIVAPYDSPSCDLGGFQEIYQRGCFSAWLKTGADGRVCFNHNPDLLLGRSSSGTARFWDSPLGFHYEADIPDTQAGRDVRTLMQRGDIRESSAAFFITQHRWETRDGARVRIIEKAELVEASPTTFAAYHSSTAQTEPEPKVDLSIKFSNVPAVQSLESLGARLRLLALQ